MMTIHSINTNISTTTTPIDLAVPTDLSGERVFLPAAKPEAQETTLPSLADQLADNASLSAALTQLVDTLSPTDLPGRAGTPCTPQNQVAPQNPVEQPQVVAEQPQEENSTDPTVAIPSAMPQVVQIDVASTPALASTSETSSLSPVSSTLPVARVNEVFLEAANAVADTIMVSPSLMRGEAGTIQVQLKPDVLGGSELSIKVEGTQMVVEFTPPTAATPQNADLAQYLVAATPQLQAHLAEKIVGYNIAVNVQRKKSDDALRIA